MAAALHLLVGDGAERVAAADWAAPAGSVPLATALLRAVTGTEPRPALALRFAYGVVETLPSAGFVLPETDVQLWLLLAQGGGDDV